MASAGVQAAAFFAVTTQRACHNSFIEWAKGDSEKAEYTVSSVIFLAQFCCIFIGWGLAYQSGGNKDFKLCFDVALIKKFFMIGFLYAMGDIFEMESVNYIDSATYTVLSQSKLIVTAALTWAIDGTKQNLMQWFILFTTTAGMLEYVLVGKTSGKSMVFSPFGVTLALVKVMISCGVAVLNTKALKTDKNPFPVQFSALKVSWMMVAFGYMIIKDGLFGSGSMFGIWTGRTLVLVFAGFILKTLFNQYLLKVLDAIWKNVSEAIGVLLVYFAKVAFLGGTFDDKVFNAGVIVILACISYILSKSQAGSKKSDIGDELNPSNYPALRRSLLGERQHLS